MAKDPTTHETPAPFAQNTTDLWADGESEEIVTTAKMCAYDPLTRL